MVRKKRLNVTAAMWESSLKSTEITKRLIDLATEHTLGCLATIFLKCFFQGF